MTDQKGLRILSLDGGDARCMSQLHILEEMMRRVEFKTGMKTLPCEYFDLIVAVDAASLIAIFLGILCMTVEEAQDAFHDIYSKVFSNADDSTEERSSALVDSIKSLLRERNVPETMKLSDKSSPQACKVAICYSPVKDLNQCKMFRNYRSPQMGSPNVTIVEALRVSCATPGLLPPSLIGSKGQEEEVLSALQGFSNPTPEAIKETYHVFGPETRISCLLSLGSGYRGVISGERVLTMDAQIAMSGERVAEDLHRRLGGLDVYHRFSVDRGLEGWDSHSQDFGAMKTHVDAYLSNEDHNISLDRCLGAANISVDVKIEQLYSIGSGGRSSSHGLPPLSAFFVMRKRPMQAIVAGLLERPETEQRIMVVSGLGGSGKTQLVLRYARDFETSYRHILFVDASSAESLRRGIITRVRAIKKRNGPTTIEEALDVLADPEDACTKDWMVVMDNADDHTVDLKEYMPMCDHGSILITTRNPELGNLAPSYHLKLDVMDHDEAVEALISSIFPPPSRSVGLLAREDVTPLMPTPKDHDAAAKIVKELHYLPIAVTQAGCYIKQNQCLHNYLDRLKSNRAKILKRATAVHRDKLKYPHSVYSSFDIILSALSPRAVQLLVVLSYFHFSNFPRPLFPVAAKSGFKHEAFDLLERDHDFEESVQCLNDILCPEGDWDEDELDQLLEELQRYSLVTLVPIHAIVTLRFHPLVLDWARDRLTSDEQKQYRSAAIRLLACGITRNDDHRLFEYFLSHVLTFLAALDTLHVNDSAALSRVLKWEKGKQARYLEIWKYIHQKVEAIYGKMNVRTNRAALQLADAYWDFGDRQKTEDMERDIVAIYKTLLGEDHWETLRARSNLARAFRLEKRYEEAAALEVEVLRAQIRTLGLCNEITAQGMGDLADTLHLLGRYVESKGVRLGEVEIRTKLLGRSSRSTIAALQSLATTLESARQTAEAERVREEALELVKSVYGDQHINTVNSMHWLATTYYAQGHYQKAKRMFQVGMETRRRVQGARHEETLQTATWVGLMYIELGQYEEAERLLKETLVVSREVVGDSHEITLGTISLMNMLPKSLRDVD